MAEVNITTAQLQKYHSLYKTCIREDDDYDDKYSIKRDHHAT
jgi:hypothetical protein